MIHQGQTSAAAAPAVPFLLRTAADPSTPHRAALLLLVAEAGRREHFGDGTRTGLLRVADLDERYDHAGHSMNRSVRAVRDAIAADAPILVALLDDADPRVRCAACYALAAASPDHAPGGLDPAHAEVAFDAAGQGGRGLVDAGEETTLVAALRARFDVESVEGPKAVDPDVVSEADGGVAAVRASLVLAIAQLGLEHRDERVAGWTRAWWSDPGQPPEVRVSAALAWLCLANDADGAGNTVGAGDADGARDAGGVDAPVPDDLRAVLADAVTEDLARALADVPWLRAVDAGGAGLSRCVDQMLNPDKPWWPAALDPWG